jgi:hypothetical protein
LSKAKITQKFKMYIQSSQFPNTDFKCFCSNLAKKLSKYSLWQPLSMVGKLLALSIAIAAFPSWADERRGASGMESPAPTVSEDVSFDIVELQQELQEFSDLFDSDRVPTIADLPVYSTQAKDLLVQNTPESIAEPTVKPTTETITETTTELTTEPEVDTSGTNPVVLTRGASLNSEYIKLTTGNYSNVTKFTYVEPFANGRMNVVFNVPLVANDVLGEGRFGLGDASIKWNWVADVNLKTGFVVAAELITPTASDRVLGSGKWIFAPSLIYVFFVNKNIIIAPAYIHNFSFAGDSDRADIHRGDFDLYMVYTADDKSWWVTSDLAISFDYQSGKVPAAWKVQFGRNLAKLSGGAALNGFVKPGIGIGGDRAFDWSLQVGLSLVGL